TIPYKSNEDVWGQRDYWATPIEFLTKNAGDCEDYAIAKYYTLSKMGISIDKLRLAYVKAIRLQQAHMILTYYESSQQEPLILDN
ncbi:transglutaminase-like cysteine peptidase, partial [Acinetobacter baumannii]